MAITPLLRHLASPKDFDGQDLLLSVILSPQTNPPTTVGTLNDPGLAALHDFTTTQQHFEVLIEVESGAFFSRNGANLDAGALKKLGFDVAGRDVWTYETVAAPLPSGTPACPFDPWKDAVFYSPDTAAISVGRASQSAAPVVAAEAVANAAVLTPSAHLDAGNVARQVRAAALQDALWADAKLLSDVTALIEQSGFQGSGDLSGPTRFLQAITPNAAAASSAPSATDPAPGQEFNERVTALIDLPIVMQILGLLRTLRFTDKVAAAIPATGRLRSVIVWTAGAGTYQIADASTWTRFTRTATRFCAQSADAPDGFLDLSDSKRFEIVNVDPVHDGVAAYDAQQAKLAAQTAAAQPGADPDAPPVNPLSSIMRPIRTTSIGISDIDLPAYVVSQSQAGQQTQAGFPPTEVTETDLRRGIRLDVFDGGIWKSTCTRFGTYTFTSGSGATWSFSYMDEGCITPTASDAIDGSGVVAHSLLAKWDGWSACVRRPGNRIAVEPDTNGRPTLEAPPTLAPGDHLAVAFEARGLPWLRFGNSYRFSIRVVDIAGNGLALNTTSPARASTLLPPLTSLAGDGKTPTPVDPFLYTRWAPIAPPTLIPAVNLDRGTAARPLPAGSATPPSGEGAYVLVSRLTGVVDGQLGNEAFVHAVRHVAAPESTVDMTMRYTVFASADGASTDESYAALSQLDAHCPHFYAPGGDDSLYFPTYNFTSDGRGVLIDPAARGIVLSGVPGSAGDIVIDLYPTDTEDLTSGITVTNKFTIPNTYRAVVKPMALRIEVTRSPPANGRPAGAGPHPPELTQELQSIAGVNEAARSLIIYMQTGTVCALSISSFGIAADWSHNALRDYIDDQLGVSENSSDPVAQAYGVVRSARTPTRSMVLVSATREPLFSPTIFPALDLVQQPTTAALTGKAAQATVQGQTMNSSLATISATRYVPGLTAERVVLKGSWPEVIDKGPGSAAPSTIVNHATIGEYILTTGTDALGLPISDNRLQSMVLQPHDFVTTDHKDITLDWTAISRYGSYIEGGAGSQSSAAWATANASDPRAALWLQADLLQDDGGFLNTAVPPPLSIDRVVPLFTWDPESGSDRRVSKGDTRTRAPFGVRVYLRRPHFQTGINERLGVVVANTADQAAFEKLRRYVSEIGRDPAYLTPGPARFANSGGAVPFSGFKEMHQAVPLLEQPTSTVTVLGYELVFDATQDLWYADVAVTEQAFSYMPFLRLALVRFQPYSLPGAEISNVSQALDVQLSSTRTLKVTRTDARTVQLLLSGPHISNGWSRFTCIAQGRNDQAVDEYGWSDVTEDALVPSPAADDTATLTINTDPKTAYSRHRIIVLEHEMHQADSPTAAAQPKQGGRLVYFDTMELS